jgi:hypothetical protein
MKGKPVLHGYNDAVHTRTIKLNTSYPLYVGWDFGFNHPCLSFCQMDPFTGRFVKLREWLGNKQYLTASYENRPSVVDEYHRILREVAGPDYPVLHFGDPHGEDKKDNAESSMDTLRKYRGINIMSRRTKIRLGLDEMQLKIVTQAPIRTDQEDASKVEPAPLFLMDRSCVSSRQAYMGGYHRGDDGQPVKDDFYDHLVDTDRYVIVNNMNTHLMVRRRHHRYQPRNKFTGY